MGEKMKLTKHQKQIVDAIIEGTVYDIPSYLKEFQKWHLRKYDLTRPLAKFTEEEGGNQPSTSQGVRPHKEPTLKTPQSQTSRL